MVWGSFWLLRASQCSWCSIWRKKNILTWSFMPYHKDFEMKSTLCIINLVKKSLKYTQKNEINFFDVIPYFWFFCSLSWWYMGIIYHLNQFLTFCHDKKPGGSNRSQCKLFVNNKRIICILLDIQTLIYIKHYVHSGS